MEGRELPHDLNAEQSVLGSMFLSKYALERAVEILSEDHFFDKKNGIIFSCLADLCNKGTPIDLTTVTSDLVTKNLLKEAGDVEYLTEVINVVPTAANADEYIKIVEDRATRRRLIKEATEIVKIGYSSTDSLGEILDKSEKKIFNVVKTRQGTEFRKIQDVLFKAQSDLETLSKNRGEITGLATGFADLDRITSGLHPNELIIIAARPAMGKTAFALNMATKIAANSDKAVAIFNLEMGAEQLANRMLSSAGQVDGTKMRTGRLEHEDWKKINEAISMLADTKIYIDDTPGITIGEIRAKCRRLASSSDGLGIVIIDYLQLITGSEKFSGNRQQEVSEISRSLKTMAMELGIPVVALAQLSRSVDGREDNRPVLSDLRESGSIEQDADIVAFLYRDDYYKKEAAIDENTSKSEFIIRKHRSGPTATINLIFKRNTSTFEDFIDVNEEG